MVDDELYREQHKEGKYTDVRWLIEWSQAFTLPRPLIRLEGIRIIKSDSNNFSMSLCTKEFEKKWMEKNGNLILKHIEETSVYNGDEDDMESFRQHAKDKKMARENPVKYCADRCIATGNCEVYEDIFELSASEVIAFCTDCVLDETKEECDLPGAFEEFMGENNGGVSP